MSDYAAVKEWRKTHQANRAEEARRWRRRHPETAAAIKRRYRENNLAEVRARDAERARARRAADPEGQRRRNVAYRQRQEERMASVAGRPRPAVCDICGEFNRQICFDHCHVSGEFRGWLCDRCNKVLGLVKDSDELLIKLEQYLSSAAKIRAKANRILGD